MEYKDILKAAVSSYVSAAVRADSEIKEARVKLSDEYAAETIETINNRLTEKLNSARSEIAAAKAKAISDIEEWGKMDGSQLTKDAALLQYDIEPSDFNTLVQRHKDNATMQKLLLKYGQQKNDAQRAAGNLSTYDLSGIETVQNRTEAAQQLAQHALSVMDMLSGNGYMKGINSTMARNAYNQFIGGDTGYYRFQE